MPRKLIVVSIQKRRARRVRGKIKDSGRRWRLSVSRSNRYLYAQLVDLKTGKTLIGVSDKGLVSKQPALAKKTKTERARLVGETIAKLALKQGVKEVAFYRGSYRYHGRVRAVAEGARKGGLKL